MKDYILADNQELTRFALETLLQHDSENALYKATDKASLVHLLKEHERAVVLLDYTLFDFADEDQLLIVADRFAGSRWLLLSDELTPQFLRRVVYASHQFSIVFKDAALSELREALQTIRPTTSPSHDLASAPRYICQRALEVILNQQHEDERPDLLTATEAEIVRSIAQGKTTKEIAAERFSSVHTINTHR
jgi:DNA-binding NarL/FixJ family response regulator